MIPKRAFFTWVGDGDLPWLRQLSIDSFSRHNPDWDVDLIRLEPVDGVRPAQLTDIERYRELATNGGWYFDTDIVFFKMFPEEHLDADLAITLDKSAFNYSANDPNRLTLEDMPGFNSIAAMGCLPGNSFFHFAYDKALERLEFFEKDGVDLRRHHYQGFGTELLNRLFVGHDAESLSKRFECKLHNVPLDLVLPVRWWDTRNLWNSTPFDPPQASCGLHWYGDTVDAKMYQSKVWMGNRHFRPCMLTDAIDVALGLQCA